MERREGKGNQKACDVGRLSIIDEYTNINSEYLNNHNHAPASVRPGFGVDAGHGHDARSNPVAWPCMSTDLPPPRFPYRESKRSCPSLRWMFPSSQFVLVGKVEVRYYILTSEALFF